VPVITDEVKALYCRMYHSFEDVRSYFFAGASEPYVIGQIRVTYTYAAYYSVSDIFGYVSRHMAGDIFFQAAARFLIMMILAVRPSAVPGVSDKALH